MKKMWLWLLYSFVACLALVVVLELLSPHLPTIDRLIYNLTMLAVTVLNQTSKQLSTLGLLAS